MEIPKLNRLWKLFLGLIAIMLISIVLSSLHPLFFNVVSASSYCLGFLIAAYIWYVVLKLAFTWLEKD